MTALAPDSSPLSSFLEYLETCNASRLTTPADIAASDQWASTVRHSLSSYGLDLSDPSILAAVCAGVVEALGAAHEHGDVVRGALAVGGALYDLALPHLSVLVVAA